MEQNPFPMYVDKVHWKLVTESFPTATQAVSRDLFISNGYYRLREAKVSYSVASNSGTLQLEVLASGDDADAGTDQLSSTISLSSTADTPLSGTVIAEPTLIGPNQRLGVVFGGTLTNLVGCLLTVYLEKMQRGVL